MRAFVAIDMPAPVRQQLVATQHRLTQQLRTQQLDRCVRWTPTNTLHLTLRFLGEIDDLHQLILEQSLAQIAQRHARLTLYAGGVGCFPNTRRPNVIWCGVQGDLAALSHLQAEVEAAAQVAGLPAESKPFQPHLTIGRLQRSATSPQLQAVGAAAVQVAAEPARANDVTPITPTVDELLFMRSELTPAGSIYTRIGVFTLQSA